MAQTESLKLTPAESLIILDPQKGSGKEMMKLTLLDLLIKQVLVSETQAETSRILKREVKKYFLRKGPNREKIPLKLHEKVLSAPLDSRDSMEIADLAKEAFEKVKGFNGFRNNYVREPLTELGIFDKVKKKRLLIPYTGYELSPKGLETRDRMQGLITEGESHFMDWMEKDKNRAMQFLTICGSNIFLLQKWDLETMKAWLKELSTMERAGGPFDYPYLWYDYDCFRSADMSGGFDFSSLNFNGLEGLDSFDVLDSGFDGMDAGDGGGD